MSTCKQPTDRPTDRQRGRSRDASVGVTPLAVRHGPTWPKFTAVIRATDGSEDTPNETIVALVGVVLTRRSDPTRGAIETPSKRHRNAGRRLQVSLNPFTCQHGRG